jgi:3-hydroxymyristoyl/3-hydroxydecanoyl-(acyl carrier protein) dehydratase
MHFDLVDRVVERSDDRIVTIKHVSMAEEYLQDHFPTFPVLPGVMMLEAMVQAARTLLGERPEGRFVLSKVRALKYGTFMPPGSTLRVEVTLGGRLEDGSFDFRGEAKKLGSSPGEGLCDLTAVSGRFSLRAASPWHAANAS